MGTSTDAILFYGYVWTEEAEEYESFSAINTDADGEWQEIVLLNRGIENPWDRYDELTVPTDSDKPLSGYEPRTFTEEGRILVDQYRQTKDDVEDDYGVELFTHGGPEWQCPALAIKGTRVVAHRGSPRRINMAERIPVVGTLQEWNLKLDRWCADLAVPLDDDDSRQGPGWFMVSDWNH